MIKKLLITLLSLTLICPIFGHFNASIISADSNFEVAYIEDDGSFTTIDTFSDFNDAKRKMAENADYVVRCAASLSPSKIIAMNSGLVYSYPARNKGSKTINIYEKLNSKLYGSGTMICVASNYEMTYHETYSTTYSSTLGYQMGWVKITLNGFTGYVDLEYTDLVPTKFIDNKLPITLGGYPSVTFNVIPKQKYYSAEKNGKYFDLVLHYYLGMPSGNDINAKGYTLNIGVAPSFMEEGVKYYSNDGVNFYSDKTLSTFVGTYYNYYQFLPARSYSTISGDTLDAYLVSKGINSTNDSVMYGTGNDFIKDQNKYGVNGAMIFAMAIHESGYGKSEIARGKYNLFGWGAFDNNTSEATRYSSVYECVKAQMADNLSNYLDESSGNYYYSMGLGNKGGGFSLKYASDPYWPEKISSHYYAIDKFSKGNNGELSDYNQETIALITKVGANVYKNNNLTDGIWYSTENKLTGYQKNLITIVLSTGENFSKVRTSNNIDEDGLLKPIEMPAGYIAPYNPETSFGYMKNSDLEILNISNKPLEPEYVQKEVDENTLTSSATISSITFTDSTISVNGMAFLQGLDFDYKPIIKHELVITNIETGNKAYFPLETGDSEGFSLNDNHNYSYINFAGSADLTDVINGQFILGIKVTNGKYAKEINLASSAKKFANIVSLKEDTTYRVVQNERYGYRLELEKFTSPFDYSSITKPSIRKSFFNLLDGFALKEENDEILFTMNAASMMYYLNYGKEENAKYSVYLVKDKDNYLALDTVLADLPEGYSDGLSSTYDYSNIGYLASGNIKELEDGTYNIIVKIENGDYLDYLDASTLLNSKFPTIEAENRTISILRNTHTNRIQLKISTSEIQGGN